MIKPFFSLCLIVAVGFSNRIEAQVVTSLDTEVRDVSELHIGFNRRSDNGTWWTDNSFIDLVEDMDPDVVRYPAGTQANYWDWSTGQFIPNTDKVWGNKEIVTISTFLNALPTRTKAIYVLNMARPTPVTGVDVNASEQMLKSDTTLALKIEDMLNALSEFEANGKLPYAVELGNEYYFGNIESGIYQIVQENGQFYSGWDFETNTPFESATKADATEISALFYLEHCKAIVTAIKTEYPEMKIALTTTKGGAPARDRWNNTIFNNLENNIEFITLAAEIDAVTQHHYLNANYGVQDEVTNVASAKVAIAEGIQYPIDKQSDYNLVPDNYKIWYTEYGEVKEIAEETWASAVRYAALIYSWLNLGEKVEQLYWHYISDNNVVNAASPMKLAPIGMAQKLIADATVDMEEMQKINFETNPISVNGIESLFGLKFKNAEKETLLIININNIDFDEVDLDNLLTYSGVRNLTQYQSLQPFISGVADGDSNILTNTSTVGASFMAGQFSISLIEVQNTLGVKESLISELSVYPNPVNDQLNFKCPNPIKSLHIYTMTGAKIYSNDHFFEDTVNVSQLFEGMYVLKVETEKGVQFLKIIKK